MKRRTQLTLGLGLLALAPLALAQGGDIALLNVVTHGNTQEYSVKIQVLILMTLVGLLPTMVLMMTCFTRFIIVLSLLRQALGLQQTPPNRILIGIALSLTMLVMRPIWLNIYDHAVVPFENDQITLTDALSTAATPLKRFMLAQTDKKAMAQIMTIGGAKGNAADQDLYRGARLCVERAENRLPDWLYDLHPVSGYRPDCRKRIDGDGDDDAVAADRFAAL